MYETTFMNAALGTLMGLLITALIAVMTWMIYRVGSMVLILKEDFTRLAERVAKLEGREAEEDARNGRKN